MEKFKKIIEELTELFAELAEVESRKLRAIAESNIKEMEACMKEEQVGIMKLKVLEKKRADAQKELSLPGQTFKQIIEGCGDGEKDELQGLYQQLEETLKTFNQNAASTKTALETNLYSIDAILEDLHKKAKLEKGFSDKKI